MGLAYYVGASQMQGLAGGLFAFYLGTDPQKLEPVKAALVEEVEKLASHGLTAAELTRAKKKLIGQQQIANQSNDSFGYQSALDELYGLGYDHYRNLEQEVETITLDQIRAVAAKYFRDRPYVMALVLPPAGASAAKEE
jgi:zinc protease